MPSAEQNQIVFLSNLEDLKRAKKNPRNQIIGDIVEDPSSFYFKLSKTPPNQQVEFAQCIQILLTDYIISLDYGVMLGNTHESCYEICKNFRLEEVMEGIQ